MYKNDGNYKEAYNNIKLLWEYCKDIEKQELEVGRIGIYELIMSYISSLLGNMERYDESKDISDKLIKISLKYRYSYSIHQSIVPFHIYSEKVE